MTTSKSDELLARIRNGNDKLRAVWLEAIQLDDTAMEYQLRRIDKAWPKLDILCLTLIASGFTSCLYGTPRCGPAADNDYFCYVCPCSLAWWKAEPAAKQIGNMS